MNRSFAGNLIAVSIVHLLAIFLILIAGAIPGCRAGKSHAAMFMPVDLVVGGRAGAATPQHLAGPVQAPAPAAPVEPVAPPKPVKPPPPRLIKPTPVKPPSQNKPVKTPKPPPLKDNGKRTLQPPRLSKKQIENELLDTASAVSTPSVHAAASDVPAAGAGNGTGSSDENTYLAVVWQTFYDAWVQPSYSDVGDAEASISIELALDGAVTGRTLARSSGNAILDASAMRAAESVQRIPGLSKDFTAENGKITVQFKVTKE